jgi:hypothetical protein
MTNVKVDENTIQDEIIEIPYWQDQQRHKDIEKIMEEDYEIYMREKKEDMFIIKKPKFDHICDDRCEGDLLCSAKMPYWGASLSDRRKLALKKFITTESMLNSYISHFYRIETLLTLFIFRLMFESKEQYFTVTLCLQSGRRVQREVFNFLEILFKEENPNWILVQKSTMEKKIQFCDGRMIRTLEFYFRKMETIRGSGGNNVNAAIYYGIPEDEKESKTQRSMMETSALYTSQLYFVDHDKDLNLKFRIIDQKKITENPHINDRLLTYEEILGE